MSISPILPRSASNANRTSRPLAIGVLILMVIVLATNRNYAQLYTVSQSGTYQIEINNPLTVPLSENTIFSVPIGFNFSFYGYIYSTCYVSQNGFVTFSGSSGDGCCVGQDIPDPAIANNLIAAAWTDQDTTILKYEVLGFSPNRRLIITLTMEDICGAEYYGQIKLFETTNVIEIHTQKWADNNTPCTSTTQGLENAAGSVAIEVPGRNSNNIWSVDNGDNDFVSFTPNEVYIVDQDPVFDMEFNAPADITVFDDSFKEVPIGFNFNFFGRTYSDCSIGGNGFLAFGDESDGGCCEGGNIPDASTPNNLIAVAWMEVWAPNCCIEGNEFNIRSYETLGTAPTRRFLVNYSMEDLNCAAYYDGQVKLFEGSNIIEIHTNFYAEGAPPCKPVTQGIENATGDQAYYLEGRVANIDWEVLCCGDVVRFTPVSSFPPFDAGVTYIDHDPVCSGSPMIDVLIRNLGSQSLDSVNVGWSWDGVLQDPVMVYDNMPVGSGDYSIDLDTQAVEFGNTYELKAWTTMPNGFVDEDQTNDTMSATIKVGLEGSFTIGGSSPDYATFASAIAALQATGICDTVIFNVRPGTYIGQISIPHIEGANGDNMIIFQAENGDSSSVILQFTSTSSVNNYVLRFDNAHNIIWQKMTMKALSTTLARVIEFKNSSYHNVIRHCLLEGRNSAVTTNSYACIYSDGYNRDNRILKNTIRYGSFGFFHNTSFYSPDQIVISENRFIDFYNKGIYAYYPVGISITRNVLESTKTNVRGIEVEVDVDSVTVTHNQIYLPSGAYGIRLMYVSSETGRRPVMANNMVNVPGTNCIAGIDLFNTHNSDVVHNTVNISIATAERFALVQSGDGNLIYNNILSNKGGGPVISTNAGSANGIDFNAYYTTGTSFGRFNGQQMEDFDQWKLISVFDDHSFFRDPLFVSSTDLHTTNSVLNAQASPDHTTAYDFDFQIRNSNNPDIGADEFAPGENDAAITGLLSPVISCAATQDVKVVLTNLGSDTLESVIIKWTINGLAQPDVNYLQSLLPEGDTAHVILTSRAFSNTPEIFKFWTSQPNGTTDAQPANDTLHHRFRLPLNGVYTIGGSSPDFTTFKSAVDDLKRFHTCGPVTMRFRNGTYNEQVIFDSIPTTSAVNTITFESENQDSSLVTLQWTVSNTQKPYTIQLNGIDYVTFRHLGLKTLSSGTATVIEAINGATHLLFSNNRFEGVLADIFYNSNYLFQSSTGKQEYITFSDNLFLGSSYALYFWNGSGNGDMTPKEFHVLNNTFTNQKRVAISLTNSDGLYIRNNIISTNTNQNFYIGIETNTASGYTEISGNTITNLNKGACLYMNFTNNTRAGEAHIFNNMARTAGSDVPLNFWNCKNINISYNNSRAAGIGDAVHVGGGDTVSLLNNVFMANSGNAYSIFTPPATFTSDYNDLFSVSGSIAYRDIFYPTMSDWQTGTGYDANSINVDPEYFSSTDLHVYADTLNSAATPVAEVTVDIDGQARHTTSPDIGADEIGINAVDAGIRNAFPQMPFARGLQEVKVIIRNFGLDTLETATISWEINGIPQPDYFFAGPLFSLEEDTVILGQYDFDLNTAYNLDFWTSDPNQVSDADVTNDTLFHPAIYAAVSGEIMVGTGGDLPTIASTITAMNLGGVLGSVEFHILPGTYHESITMLPASYQSCNAPIIYTSSTGNAADVIWDNVGTGTHTILLDGADGIQFRNLTIKTLLNTFQAIHFRNASTCNLIEHCILEGVTTTSTSSTYAVVRGFSTNSTNYNHNNVIQYNSISKGSMNVQWDGGTGTGTTGIVVQHNVLANAYYIAAYFNRVKAPVLHANTITTNSAISHFYGFYQEFCHENNTITANQILLHGRKATGIILDGCNGTATLPVQVANNFVILGNAGSSYGNHFSNCNYVRVLHNTIRISGGNNTGLNIWRQNGANTTILNNILDNQVNGRTLYFDGAGVFTSNYNVHYTEGTNLVYNTGTNYTTLAAWQATGRDINSLHEEPLYDVSAPLSYKVENSSFDGTGSTSAGVLTDIEGMQRGVSTRDIGCDEYDLFTHDVGLVSISFPNQPFPEGLNTVFLKFNNNGEDTLRSMEVHWEINDIPQPVYEWTGLLISAGTYDSLDIGEFHFEPGFYHKIKAWVSLPNGVQDQLPVNDTLTVDDLYPALSGPYTIGGTDPDFESLTEAVHVLNEGGAYGPVTFNIRSGTYLDTLHIKDFEGSECNNPVVFQAETGNASDVLITNLGFNAHTIVLDGADGVIFQNLSIVSVNTAFRHAVSYSNQAHCNQFLDNIITGFQSTSSAASAAVIHSATGLDTANVFTGNHIKYGSHSFYLLGNSAATSNTVISGNVMDLPYTRGVYGYYEYGLRIDSNYMNVLSNSSRGVELELCHRMQSISGNKIETTLGDYGILLYDCDGLTTAPAVIANNFISVSGSGVARGVYMTLSSYTQIVYNNIHVYSSNTSLANTAPIYMTSCQAVSLINNVLANSGFGYSIYSNNNTPLTSDHNAIYAEGISFGYWNGIVAAGLSEWQLSSGKDLNSLDVNPQFMSDLNLHVSNILLNGAGLTLSYIGNDIDGNVRSNPPDIGADEFNPSLANDAGVFMVVSQMIPFVHGSQPVKIAVKNYGSDTLNTVKIRWVINGIEQPVYNWSGVLLSAQCDTVMVGNYIFASHAAHDMIFWTELPNNIPDSVSLNDTISVFNLYPSLSGVYTVGGILPDFNLFSQVEEALNLGGISGDVTFSIRNGVYASQLSIGEFPRTAPGYEVTFTSESGDSSQVTLLRNFTAANNYTVQLNNAHDIRFENITMASTKGRVVDLINGSSRITIANCRLEGIQLTNGNSAYHLIYSSTTSEDSINIINNHFEFGDNGIYLIGSSGDHELRNIISGNTFENCFSTSVFSRYSSGLQVNDNRIINTISRHEAILVWNASGSPSISRNDIRLEGGSEYAIYVYQIYGSALLPASINNNYIYVSSHPGIGTDAILQDGAGYVHYNYNTVRLENTHPSSVGFRDGSSSGNIQIRNSIFANHSGGPAIHVPWITGSSNSLNYCNLYTTGSLLAHHHLDYYDHLSFQSNTNQNLQGKNIESIFVSPEPDVFQDALNGAAIPVSGVNTDIDGKARHVTTPDIGAREFTLLTHDIGARQLSAPETYCGLSASEEITVRIQNYGASTETGFNVSYSLDGAVWITENVGSLMVTPGGFLDYTFTTEEDLSDIGLYHFAIRTSLGSDQDHSNDTTWNIAVEHIPALTLPAANLLPVDGQGGLETTVSLSWAPAPHATLYDIYLWVSSGSQPATPQLSNLSQINTLYHSLAYGEEYKWRVVAKNVCNQMVSSPVHNFTIRNLPNLQVDTVIAPATAFSGQTIELEWQVRNAGPGSTQSTVWSDAVFLSTDATLNTSFDTYIGSVQNLAALDVDVAYTNTGEFTIPNGMVGNFYVFVQADRWNNLAEINNNNNWDRAVSPMMITLTPSPDLVVDEVTIPGSGFSGQPISVVFTVRNNGLGTADALMWRDLISIGINPQSAAGGTQLKNIVHAAHLQPDSTYEVTTTATIPQNISGDYYIYIHTDYLNQEYEFGAENNNTIISDTLEVFLTPPPDLIPLSITIPDTVSSNEILTMSWTVQNAGATAPTVNYWYDRIDLSPSPIYNSNFNTQLTSSSHGPPLPPGATYEKFRSVTIPAEAHGDYYLYAHADIYDYVFEYSFESNNVFRRPDHVGSPGTELEFAL